jgi:hypothetical protein
MRTFQVGPKIRTLTRYRSEPDRIFFIDIRLFGLTLREGLRIIFLQTSFRVTRLRSGIVRLPANNYQGVQVESCEPI